MLYKKQHSGSLTRSSRNHTTYFPYLEAETQNPTSHQEGIFALAVMADPYTFDIAQLAEWIGSLAYWVTGVDPPDSVCVYKEKMRTCRLTSTFDRH